MISPLRGHVVGTLLGVAVGLAVIMIWGPCERHRPAVRRSRGQNSAELEQRLDAPRDLSRDRAFIALLGQVNESETMFRALLNYIAAAAPTVN